MTLYSAVGLLGSGKTLSAVMWAYGEYCKGRTVYSNIWLDFPHVPIKKPVDFLYISYGATLLDELWHLADNRNSMSKLNKMVNLVLLRSRKMDFDIYYTQQFLQTDIRLAFVTDFIIKTQCYPYDPRHIVKYTPEILVKKMYLNGNLTKPLIVETYKNVQQYFSLYDTHADPYTFGTEFSNEEMDYVITQISEKKKN